MNPDSEVHTGMVIDLLRDTAVKIYLILGILGTKAIDNYTLNDEEFSKIYEELGRFICLLDQGTLSEIQTKNTECYLFDKEYLNRINYMKVHYKQRYTNFLKESG